MSSSLASLVVNLERDDFKHLQKHYSKNQINCYLEKEYFLTIILITHRY